MKAVALLLLIIAGGGVVIGLGYFGILIMPGITPAKKHAPQPPASTTAEPPAPSVPAPASKPEPEPVPRVEVPVKDGTDRLAKLWATLDADALSKILAKWPDGEAIP